MGAVGEMVNVIHYFNCLSLIIRSFVLVENYFGVYVTEQYKKYIQKMETCMRI